MDSQSLNSETVLNFIRENISNTSFTSKVKEIMSSNNDSFEVPAWQQQEVKNRLEDYNKNPDNVLDFDKAMDEIEASL